MIDPNSITKDMPVIGSDGETLGQVDGVEGSGTDARIKLKRNTSSDGQHHYVPIGDVARVDEHVHLSRAAGEVRSGWLTAGVAAGAAGVGAAGVGAAPVATTTTTTTTHADHGAREVHVEEKREAAWLPWLLGGLALLALLFFGLRSCDGSEPAAVTPVANEVAAVPVDGDVVVPVAEETVTLPGGGTMMLAPRTIGYDLQRYLASGEAAPRTFEFERLNFDTAKADIRAVDRPTVDGIGQILAAYPAARVRLVGYADARGAAAANADLGANRARAVMAALVARGVAANRIETATGGELNETDTNTTSAGQAENRRTELVVLAK